jgi:2-methylisocitrate lyase-like PEP mutase family enzyme
MNNPVDQRKMAEKFVSFHSDPELLVLPNAWDAVSAKIYETTGFKAVGTTSAGIAAVLGYPDGQRMSLEENLSMVRRMTRSLRIPVSADIEAGYLSTRRNIGDVVRSVIDSGAVGLNLEDGTGDGARPLFPVSVMVERIRGMRRTADEAGIPICLNLRTDVYLVEEMDSEQSFRLAVERGNAYREAGADCIFVPDVGDLDKNTIRLLVKEIKSPLNIIAGDNTPTIAELQDLGVSRLSTGPRPMRACLSLLRKMAGEWLVDGSYSLMNQSTLTYSEVNSWFEEQAE